MKKLFTISMLAMSMLLLAQQADAQLSYGIKGGLNISNMKNMTSLPNIQDSESYTGYHAGLFLGVKLAIVSVQADVLYSVQGVSLLETGSTTEFKDLENTYINVPIMAKIHIIPLMNIQAGLQYSFLTKSVFDGSAEYPIGGGQPVNIQDQFSSGDAAILIGLGFDISKLVIDLRYNVGVSDNNSALPTTEQLSSGNFQISVGFRIK